MNGQLNLDGREHTAAATLTPRQETVYDLVLATDGGISADEAGALAHETRERRPHSRDERCEWCGQDGRQILEALHRKGLVRRRRRNDRHGRGLVYVPLPGQSRKPSSQTEEIPF